VTVQPKTTLRFLFWLGLLLFEASLVIAFYGVPLFQPHLYNTHPDIGMEVDTVLQHYPWLKIALIAYLALFLFGNVGLIVMVRRAFKNLRGATRSE
jgi:glucan phosphoethanolaminetransferase (alkaline phosphatase superfamily)